MKHSTIVLLARISIIALAFLGLCVSILYIPGLLTEDAAAVDLALNDGLIGTQSVFRMIFLEICVLPCYAILAIGWMLTVAIERDTVFTTGAARLFRVASFLLCGDAVFYLLGNIAFFVRRCTVGLPVLPVLRIYLIRLVFVVIVLICSLVCAVLYQYLNKAAELKEDNDSIL